MSELLSKQNRNEETTKAPAAPKARHGFIETLDASKSPEQTIRKPQPQRPALQRPTANIQSRPPRSANAATAPAGPRTQMTAKPSPKKPSTPQKPKVAAKRRAVKRTARLAKVAVIAVALVCLCTGIVSAVLLSDSDSAEPVADAVIGKAFDAADAESASESYSYEPEAKAAEDEEVYRVDFTFYKKDSVSCYTSSRTVGELIDTLGIQLDEGELARTDTNAVISADTEINVDSVEYGTDTSTVAVAYETRYVDVQSIPHGTTRVHQAGRSGTKTIEYKVTYLNGVECEREQTAEYISTAPTEQIVYRGVGGTVTLGGSTYNYSYYIDCKSTVYTGGGITASGLPATENVIAVDPRVIPLGTRVYIDGVGFRTAADTGGSIKGNFIDIYYDTSNPNFAGYGIRNVRVYIF